MRAAGPAAAGSLALHAGDSSIDDRGPLEFRKDGEHLHHHPASRRGGIEGLRG
jgi:hypothetical protein